MYASTIDPAGRDALSKGLQASLQEALWVSLLGKQLHWNVVGAGFLPLHEELDRVVEDARTWMDDLAERLVTIGGTADGSVGAASAGALGEFPAARLATSEAVRTMAGALAVFDEHLRERARDAAGFDAVTEDLYIGILRGLEKHRWMLEVQLEA